MKINSRTGLLVCLFLLVISPLKAQPDSLQAASGLNVIHGEFGIVGLSASYERTIRQLEKGHLNLRMGIGYVLTYDLDEGLNIFPSIQYIRGKNWFHFEAGLGINLIYNDYYPKIIPIPLVQIGLRIEPPGTGPVFRMGIGTENSFASVGVGWKF